MTKAYLTTGKRNRASAQRFAERLIDEIRTTWANAGMHGQEDEVYAVIIHPLMHMLMDIHHEHEQEQLNV